MNLIKSLIANIFVFPGYLVQKLGAIITGIGYSLHVILNTNMGEKIKQAQSTLNQFKQQMKEFEKAIKNGEDPNQRYFFKYKLSNSISYFIK